MTRRTMHALAVIVVAAVASMVWAQPAHAAPDTPCSVEEWRNPTGFVDCARRAGQDIGNSAGCVTAPTPGSPTSGLAGWFTSRPDSSLRSGVGGQYSMYGTGGYGLDTYDIGCLGTVKFPDLVAWNAIASTEFSTAASVIGAANAMRERAYSPSTMWGWSDDFVKTATDAIFEHLFTPIGALTLALIGAWLMWRARLGEMSQAMRVTAWALLVMVAVTGVARWPVAAAHGADKAATAGLAAVHRVLGPGPQDIPADKCVMGPEACKDHRNVAVRSSDVATEAVLYRTWLRAVLGSSDSITARTYGPALYDATTLTWGEADRADQNRALRQQLIEQKAATWNTVAEKIRTEDPQAYEHLQGVHGADRAGAGMVAMLSAAAFALFDMAASMVILFGFLIFRVGIILLPLLGTIGLFLPASGGVRRIFHMFMAAAMNIVVFGAGAGLYLTAVDLIFNSALPGAAQTVAVALAGVACLLVLHPFRHLVHTATGRSRREDGLATRLIKAGKEVHAAKSQPASTAPQPGSAPPAPGQRPRPEAAQTRSATASVVAAVAPSVATAAGHPLVGAAIAAATKPRPETRK